MSVCIFWGMLQLSSDPRAPRASSNTVRNCGRGAGTSEFAVLRTEVSDFDETRENLVGPVYRGLKLAGFGGEGKRVGLSPGHGLGSQDQRRPFWDSDSLRSGFWPPFLFVAARQTIVCYHQTRLESA